VTSNGRLALTHSTNTNKKQKVERTQRALVAMEMAREGLRGSLGSGFAAGFNPNEQHAHSQQSSASSSASSAAAAAAAATATAGTKALPLLRGAWWLLLTMVPPPSLIDK
jgi:mevalonate pyrophosphate decarboxylase